MIIGFSGKKQHGKSTLTNYLVKHYNFHEMFWAMPLKEIIGKQLFGFSNEQLYGDDVAIREKVDPMWGLSPRELLQKVGTECFRQQICDDFWVKLGVKRIQELQERNPDVNIVISDCRFLNEVEAIKNLNGKIIRIVKTGVKDTDQHPSEIALDFYTEFDKVISAAPGMVQKLEADIDWYLRSINAI